MDALAVHVHEFVPAAEGEELAHRIALLKARDHAAMLRGRLIDEDAFDWACQAHEFAGAWVYADASADQLKLAVSVSQCLVQAAFAGEFLSTGAIAQ